jgi:phosphoglycerate dehydrogenase-like enzyme
MAGHTLLVLSNPAARQLRLLARLPEETTIIAAASADAFAERAAMADAVLVNSTHQHLLETLWPRLTRVRWVHSLAAGVEPILFPALVESPVPLTNSRGVYARSLGEFALAGMLFFAKHLRRMVADQQARRWDPFDVAELHGATLGIVGYGEIGRATAARARAFGMHVWALRRRPNLSAADPLVDRCVTHDGFGELLAAADYLLVSAPLTPTTRGLIGAAELSRMKPTAVVINLGRGPVIDEDALVQALSERSIGGAVLDVFDREPLPPEHPFWSLDNVLLSPHCADHTPTWQEDAVEFFLSNFARFSAGQPLENVVDKRAGY